MDTLRTHVHVSRTDGNPETIVYNILHELLSFVGDPCKPSRLEMYMHTLESVNDRKRILKRPIVHRKISDICSNRKIIFQCIKTLHAHDLDILDEELRNSSIFSAV